MIPSSIRPGRAFISSAAREAFGEHEAPRHYQIRMWNGVCAPLGSRIAAASQAGES